ncbi:MAG: substrate-binding domain-containing protein [Lachnospiraceae bacterium]|nr:substrate-binding domain-containing protein [Lachnospiraceae bacterium]
MKKKALALLLGICMITMTACGNASSQTSGEAPASTADEGAADDTAGAEDAQAQGEAAGSAVAGVVWYNFADTFISNARQTLINIGAADGTITITDADSTNDVSTQTSNMNNFFTQGVDYLVLNNINTGAITEICDQIQAEGCYGIFANTDTPSDEDFAKNDKLYSVSSVATQSGTIMGEALAEYWQAHPEADRNGNGKLDYVMLLGIQGHYDTTVRSQYSVQALEDAGIEVNNIGGEIICDYSRATAQEKVAALLANYSDDIDAVIACNDDMALGAIEALKAGGFFTGDDTYLPVCGVDATVNGCQAIKDGTMLVTALNNPVMLAKSIYKVMYLTNSGQEVTTESMGLEGVSVEGHRVWLDYSPVTIDNVDQATYDINDTAF